MTIFHPCIGFKVEVFGLKVYWVAMMASFIKHQSDNGLLLAGGIVVSDTRHHFHPIFRTKSERSSLQ